MHFKTTYRRPAMDDIQKKYAKHMNYIERRKADEKYLIQDFGNWIRDFGYDWKLFSTLTFPPTYYNFYKQRTKMNSFIAKWWFDEYIKLHDDKIFYFVVMEHNMRFMDNFHCHLLVGGLDKMMKWTHGIEETETYDQKRGAGYYVSKLIPSGNFWWDIEPPKIPSKEKLV